MATFDSKLVKKKVRIRGTHSGKTEAVTGVLRVTAGSSFALADLLRMVPLGENIRPVRLILTATPVSGTPVLTNADFDVGAAPIMSGTHTRADGTTYAPLSADVDILAPNVTVNADNMATVIEVARPVADSVSKYGPFYVTLQPTGAGAFSVAGGDIDLALTVEFRGEQKADAFVYEEYVNQKVKN